LRGRLVVLPVDFHEVVGEHEQAHRMPQVFNLLAESQSQAREPSVEHPVCQICPLNEAGADVAFVRCANRVVLSPINVIMLAQFTNLRDEAMAVNSYQFEGRTTNGNWEIMPTIDIKAGSMISFVGTNLRLRGVKFEDALKRIISAPLPPKKAAKKAVKKLRRN
jgi:hypothetical protein